MAQESWKVRAEAAEARVKELETELSALRETVAPKETPKEELVEIGNNTYVYRPVEAK